MEPLLAGVGTNLGKLRVQGRFATGEDHAEVLAANEIVHEFAHRFERMLVGRRRVGAETTEVIAVPADLDVADVGQGPWMLAGAASLRKRVEQRARKGPMNSPQNHKFNIVKFMIPPRKPV